MAENDKGDIEEKVEGLNQTIHELSSGLAVIRESSANTVKILELQRSSLEKINEFVQGLSTQIAETQATGNHVAAFVKGTLVVIVLTVVGAVIGGQSFGARISELDAAVKAEKDGQKESIAGVKENLKSAQEANATQSAALESRIDAQLKTVLSTLDQIKKDSLRPQIIKQRPNETLVVQTTLPRSFVEETEGQSHAILFWIDLRPWLVSEQVASVELSIKLPPQESAVAFASNARLRDFGVDVRLMTADEKSLEAIKKIIQQGPAPVGVTITIGLPDRSQP